MALTACGYRGPLYLPDETPLEQPAEPINSGDLPSIEADDGEDEMEENGVVPA